MRSSSLQRETEWGWGDHSVNAWGEKAHVPVSTRACPLKVEEELGKMMESKHWVWTSSQRARSPNARTRIWLGETSEARAWGHRRDVIRKMPPGSQRIEGPRRKGQGEMAGRAIWGGIWLLSTGRLSMLCPPNPHLTASYFHKGEQFHPPASCPTQKPGSLIENPSLSFILDICSNSESPGWEIWVLVWGRLAEQSLQGKATKTISNLKNTIYHLSIWRFILD